MAATEERRLPWKDQGVYLITGGAGGLGLLFAREIAQQAKRVVLVLTGRSTLNAEKRRQLQELEALGAQVHYKQVDVTHKEAVTKLVHTIAEEHEGLDGIIHSAGIMQDNFILKKSRDEVQAVVAVEGAGLVNLDEASKDMALDFLICFSSLAGAYGNVGQADYAAGNAFMDAYAGYRNSLVALEQRHGPTLSVNWALWQDGGMQMDSATEQMLMQGMGMRAMSAATGIDALYRAWASGQDQIVVVEGNVARLKQALLSPKAATAAAAVAVSTAAAAPQIAQDVLQDKAEHYFKKLLSSALKLPVSRIDAPLRWKITGLTR